MNSKYSLMRLRVGEQSLFSMLSTEAEQNSLHGASNLSLPSLIESTTPAATHSHFALSPHSPSVGVSHDVADFITDSVSDVDGFLTLVMRSLLPFVHDFLRGSWSFVKHRHMV